MELNEFAVFSIRGGKFKSNEFRGSLIMPMRSIYEIKDEEALLKEPPIKREPHKPSPVASDTFSQQEPKRPPLQKQPLNIDTNDQQSIKKDLIEAEPLKKEPLREAKQKREPAPMMAMDIFGPPRLMKSEDLKVYNSIHDAIYESMKPKDVIEQIWARDIVDLSWEIVRLRNLKNSVLARQYKSDILADIETYNHHPLNKDVSEKTYSGWMKGDRGSVKKVSSILDKRGLNFEEAETRAAVNSLANYERIEKLIAGTEARRNAVIREIDRRRHALAVTAREKSDRAIKDHTDVVDVE